MFIGRHLKIAKAKCMLGLPSYETPCATRLFCVHRQSMAIPLRLFARWCTRQYAHEIYGRIHKAFCSSFFSLAVHLRHMIAIVFSRCLLLQTTKLMSCCVNTGPMPTLKGGRQKGLLKHASCRNRATETATTSLRCIVRIGETTQYSENYRPCSQKKLLFRIIRHHDPDILIRQRTSLTFTCQCQ